LDEVLEEAETNPRPQTGAEGGQRPTDQREDGGPETGDRKPEDGVEDAAD
jgi:hypothetical protein